MYPAGAKMIEIKDIIIIIPQSKVYQASILINGEEVKNRVYQSEWTKQINLGVGYFRVTLVNTGGAYSNRYAKDQEAKFYIDHIDGTTLQFYGKIDKVSERLEKQGQFIDIEGRHRAYRATEVYVGYSATEMDTGALLRAVIAMELPEITTTFIPNTGVFITKEWDHVPFFEFIKEITSYSGYDFYIDNDLVAQFFQANSITNDDASIANDNFLKNEGVGKDGYYEKTRVTVAGQTESGVPVVYTAISPTEDTNDIRELYVQDANAINEEMAQSIAEAKLAEITNRPKQGKFTSCLLVPVKEGDNIPIVLPRQKLYAYYKVLKFSHLFGIKVGIPQTITDIEVEAGSTTTVLQSRVEIETRNHDSENINKLQFSFTIGFTDETKISSMEDTFLEDGSLKLQAGKTTGTMVTNKKATQTNITKVELKYAGRDLGASTFVVSANNDATSAELERNVPTTLSSNDQGKALGLTVTLISDTTNPAPQLDSLTILYNT